MSEVKKGIPNNGIKFKNGPKNKNVTSKSKDLKSGNMVKSKKLVKSNTTFNSHTNGNKHHINNNISDQNMSDIDSESDWEYEGPLQLAPNPNERSKHQKNPPPPPQRHWNNEPLNYRPANVINYHPNQNSYGNGNSNRDNNEGGGAVWQRQSYKKYNSRQNSPKRENKVDRYSYQVTEIGRDGEQTFEERTIFKDDIQVEHTVSQKKKINRVQHLRKSNINKLEGMKERKATRFVLTKVNPELTPEDVECYILENFDEINDVYVRKKPMKNHTNYATFVFIINSQEEIDCYGLETHDWPDGVRCFLSPNEPGPRY